MLSNSSNSSVKNSDLRLQPVRRRRLGHERPRSSTNNDVSNSLQAGIELGDGVSMVITNNVANLTGGAGISLEGGAFDAHGGAVGGALIEGNTAQRERRERHLGRRRDATRSATTRRNNNAGYGIEAGEEPVPGEPLDPNREHRRRRQQGERQPRRRRVSARPARRGPVPRRRLRRPATACR